MNNPITSDEVANQVAKAIQIMLEWVRQEMRVPVQPKLTKLIHDQEQDKDKILLDLKRLLKPKEVADILQVSRSMVYRMMQRGEIHTVRIGDAMRVRESDLDKFINQTGIK